MVTHSPAEIQKAYQHCQKIVAGHYENFPVASLLLPKTLRQPIAVIYAFARSADDFADEGNQSEAQRLASLDKYASRLDQLGSTNIDDPVFIALHDVIARHKLPLQLFHDLLSAFKQDVTKKRYQNFSEVLDYCRRSANPVGRLLLHLLHEATPENLADSDAICSSLQLINFLQDIQQDYQENDRIYLPLDEMQQLKVSESLIAQQQTSDAMRVLINQQIARAKTMMLEGADLGNRIPGRFGLQLRMMINGGLRILELLELQKENVFSRPRLKKIDWLRIARHALLRTCIQ